jgi:hypothetical protein
VIVLPGGGYSRISENESTTVVAWLESIGMSASYFSYPVSTRHPAVLDAVRGEIRARRDAGADRIDGMPGPTASRCSDSRRAGTPPGTRRSRPGRRHASVSTSRSSATRWCR